MNRPTLIILVGPPGTGKTTYAHRYIEEHPGTTHLSSDAIRKELHGDESIQDNPGEVFTIMQKRTIASLDFGYDVIYDATNMTRKDRAGIIGVCPKFAKIECHIVWASIETCIERDTARKRTVGKEVIDRMLKRFQAPFFDECIDEIKVIRPDNFDHMQYMTDIFNAMRIPHDNPHHTLDIYDHCCEAQDYACVCGEDDTGLVALAAMVHDAGKPYVKAFIDSKGNPCEVAHYYQHQCISAWLAYGIYGESTPIDVAWLCSVHMDPYLNTKYYNKLPTYLKKQVDLLHEADLNSH
jgi:predicted kinase